MKEQREEERRGQQCREAVSTEQGQQGRGGERERQQGRGGEREAAGQRQRDVGLTREMKYKAAIRQHLCLVIFSPQIKGLTIR